LHEIIEDTKKDFADIKKETESVAEAAKPEDKAQSGGNSP